MSRTPVRTECQSRVSLAAWTGALAALFACALSPAAALEADPRDFGALADGVSDDTAALQAAYDWLAAGGGGLLRVPALMALASAGPGLSVPNNVTTQCADLAANAPPVPGSPWRKGGFVVAGDAVLSTMFTAKNPENVWFRNCQFIGNGRARSYGSRGGALVFSADETATADMADFGAVDCAWTHFQQDYWNGVLNASGHVMRRIRFIRPSVVSAPGDSCDSDPRCDDRGVPALTQVSTAFSVQGQFMNPDAIIEDVAIEDPVADGTYIKEFAAIWAGVRDYRISGGSLRNFGQWLAPLEAQTKGAYAILLYGNIGYGSGESRVAASALRPTHGVIENVAIDHPYDVGVYAPGAVDLTISHVLIAGQNSRFDDLLPKAAIVAQNARGLRILDSDLRDNFGGVYLSGLGDGENVLRNVRIRDEGASASFGVKVASSSASSWVTAATAHDGVVTLTLAGELTLREGLPLTIENTPDLEPCLASGRPRAIAADARTVSFACANAPASPAVTPLSRVGQPASFAQTRTILDNPDIAVTGKGAVGLILQSSGGAEPGHVEVHGGRIAGARSAALAWDSGSTCGDASQYCGSGGLSLTGTTLAGGDNIVSFPLTADPLVLSDATFDMRGLSPTGVGLYAPWAKDIRIAGLRLAGSAPGGATALNLWGARGAMAGVTGVTGADLLETGPDADNGFGALQPAWRAPAGTFIQNLAATPHVAGWAQTAAPEGADWRETLK